MEEAGADGGTGADTPAQLVLRPSPLTPRARRQLVEAAVMVCLVVGAVGAVSAVVAFPFGWLVVVLALAWYGLAPLLYFRNTSLYVTGGRAGKTDLLGRRVEVAAAQIATVRLARVGRRTTKLLAEDGAGRVLFAVYPTAWRRDQIEAFRHAVASGRLGTALPDQPATREDLP